MGHSYVDARGHSRRLSDARLTMAICFVADAAAALRANAPEDEPYWNEIAAWLPMVRDAAPGCIELVLDPVLASPARVIRTRLVLDDATRRAEAQPLIAGAYFNERLGQSGLLAWPDQPNDAVLETLRELRAIVAEAT